jgi:DNA-binding response OmpR family regulator
MNRPEQSALIFIVEDERAISQLISDQLMQDGFQTAVFTSAEAALNAILTSNLKPNLLVTDFRLPGLNGLELIERAKAVLPGLKTISISATLREADLCGRVCKPDRFLPKPFRHNELSALVTALIAE